MKLVNAVTMQDVPGASVTVNTAGVPAGFKYVALAAPISLPANSAYFLVSQEFSGGDQRYQGVTPLASASGIAESNFSTYSPDGVNYTTSSTYIPVSFTYTLTSVPVPFVGDHAMTRLRDDRSGWFGMKFTTGASAIIVGELGRWVVPGNSDTHTVRLLNVNTGAILGSSNVVTAGAPSGQFKYNPLVSAVTLEPNTSYYVISQESAGGDQWFDFGLAASGMPTGYQQWLLANGLPMDASGNGSASSSPANDGLPNLIKYALGLAPAVSGNGGRLNYGTASDSGNDYLSFTYTRPEPAPGGISYSVEAGSDLSAGAWSASGLVETNSTVNGGLRTITIRDSVPMSGGGSRFMRLNVGQP
jgi:hypothetical protein